MSLKMEVFQTGLTRVLFAGNAGLPSPSRASAWTLRPK